MPDKITISFDALKLTHIIRPVRIPAAGAQKDHHRRALKVTLELLLEVPTAEVEEVTVLVKEAMEGVADFAVPLQVNTAVGENWNDAHG